MHHDYLDKYRELKSPWSAIDPTGRLVLCLVMVVSVATLPFGQWQKLMFLFLLTATALNISLVPMKYFILRSILLAWPAWLISLPMSIYQPQKYRWFIFFALKSWIAVSTMLLLISSTSFPRLLKSLRDLKVPRLIISLLSFTYRYLFLLVEESERLELAFKSRTFSKKNAVKRKAFSGILGTLFIRSLERSDMVYQAMLARGYNGVFPLQNPGKLKASDLSITIILILLILGIRVFV